MGFEPAQLQYYNHGQKIILALQFTNNKDFATRLRQMKASEEKKEFFKMVLKFFQT